MIPRPLLRQHPEGQPQRSGNGGTELQGCGSRVIGVSMYRLLSSQRGVLRTYEAENEDAAVQLGRRCAAGEWAETGVPTHPAEYLLERQIEDHWRLVSAWIPRPPLLGS